MCRKDSRKVDLLCLTDGQRKFACKKGKTEKEAENNAKKQDFQNAMGGAKMAA